MVEFEEYLVHSLDDVTNSNIKEAMQYSLMAGGKRIRPRLLLASLQAYNIDPEVGYRAAAAIEMLHTYSLIHDDLPAMDDDTLRRGKPTCHIKYGEAIAILAGDALLTHAFLLASTASSESYINANMVEQLARFSGADGMILGQLRDLQAEETKYLEYTQLESIHIYKTGKLLTLPFVFAAYLAKREDDIPAWKEIGTCIGLSFQIQDDILDVTGSVEVLGKHIHSDIAHDKATYVKLMGIEKASEEADAYYQKASALLHTLHLNEDPIYTVFHELAKRKN